MGCANTQKIRNERRLKSYKEISIFSLLVGIPKC